LVLNEPETSPHPELLLPPLAELINTAARHTQIVAVTHSRAVQTALHEAAEVRTIELYKEFGQTLIVGQDLLDEPSWHWQVSRAGLRPLWKGRR
jgi:predicted ATPase